VCETWFLKLREDLEMRACENSMLRRIFKPKKDVLTGERRELRNQELQDLKSCPIIIRMFNLRMIRLEGYIARMGRRIIGTRFWW
jgi:hypothetical protein